MSTMADGVEGQFLTLHEFVKEAKSRLSPGNWDYLVGATETASTVESPQYPIPSARRDGGTSDTT